MFIKASFSGLPFLFGGGGGGGYRDSSLYRKYQLLRFGIRKTVDRASVSQLEARHTRAAAKKELCRQDKQRWIPFRETVFSFLRGNNSEGCILTFSIMYVPTPREACSSQVSNSSAVKYVLQESTLEMRTYNELSLFPHTKISLYGFLSEILSRYPTLEPADSSRREQTRSLNGSTSKSKYANETATGYI